MTGPTASEGVAEANLPALPDHVSISLREFRATRSESTEDAQLEAVRAAILIEEIADVVLTDDHIDPDVLADGSSMVRVVRSLRGNR